MKKCIVAICPGDLVTGGPELIHQFIDRINENGGNGKILYFPFDKNFETPEAYSSYNIDVTSLNEINQSESCFIVPEVATSYVKYLNSDDIHIWWLSVNNYFSHKKTFSLGFLKHIVKKIVNHKSLQLGMTQLSQYKHWVQSQYAKDFLKEHNIESDFLSDFLNEKHLNQDVSLSNKENIICYNPKKGIEITNKLITLYPNFKFVPIQNMSAKQVSDLLKSSKIYIDFGEHPGKDRIPREAAMAMCVVVTGVKGSAKNNNDIPVSQKYKLNESSSNFYEQAGSILEDIFENFEEHLNRFSIYRTKISCEKELFNSQVIMFMEKYKL